MSGHAPGPWRKGERESYLHAIKIIDERGFLVAEARGATGPWADVEANARLIIAAVNACFAVNPDNPLAVAEALPELVEACRFYIQRVGGYPISSRHRVENALAKMEGKP